MNRAKVFVIARDYGACTHIRMRQVARKMQEQNIVNTMILDVGQTVPEANHMMSNGMVNADIVWFGRSVSESVICHTRKLQELGKKIIIDLDDFIFNVSPWSAHYDLFGTEEFYCDGKPVWKDKVNINIANNKKSLKEYETLLGSVDALSVTTPRLMESFKPYVKKIFVFPNAIDTSIWNYGQPMRRNPDEVRILWQGGVSHYEDFWQIKEVIPAITKKYPQAKWVMMGAKWDFFWKDIPKDRMEYHDWVHMEAYPHVLKLLAPDIGVCPLADTVFNQAKSSIKYYEHAALSVPTVASNVPPYCDDIEDGRNGYLASSAEEWVVKLSRLIEDSVDRSRMGGEARRYVDENRSLEVVAPLVAKAMEAFVNGKTH